MDAYTLANGLKIPKIGFGTWQIPNDAAAQAVSTAIDVGYRHIDTAAAYENEDGVGQGIRNSGILRRELFVTTKITADIKTYEEAKSSINNSLRKLGLDYVDLMLIHAPRPWKAMIPGYPKNYFEENVQVWRAMEEACRAGKIRSLGLSKCDAADVENIIIHCKILPTVNQIKVHVGLVPEKVMTFCRENNILIEAFSPIGTGQLLHEKEIVRIAERYCCTVPQLCIRYVLQKGAVALTKTTHREYMAQNLETGFVISGEDMKLLDALEYPC